jgi:uncharacterized phage protein gp47/JayE
MSTRLEVINRMKSDVKANLLNSNPWLRNSFIGAIVTGFAGRIFDFYYQLGILYIQLFPHTAKGIWLELWGSLVGITRNAATQSTGNIAVQGTAGTVIPLGTTFQSSDSYTYDTTASATIANNIVSVSTLTSSGTTATVTTASNHNLASGLSVTIAGANETDYNGTYIITVTGLDTFIYTVSGSPATPATGTVTAEHDTASIPLLSDDYGQDVNLDAGAPVSITVPIAGLEDTAYVQFGAVGGGTDLETDEDLRERILFKWRNPATPFNEAQIEIQAKSISGVTRVWVESVTPSFGQVTVYFVRDNDASIIPSASEVTTVKNKILLIKPADVADGDVIVSAPAAVSTDFTFSALAPNTSTIQTAITNNLTALFAEKANIGVDITENQYNAAIQTAYDSETGSDITFTLSNPSGDISIAAGEIAILGTITYP